jgi:predicted esterase
MNELPRELPIEFSTVETILPFSYRHRAVNTPKVLVIFLHGYSDHGGSFIRRLYPEGWPAALKDAAILVPNGPFPVPVKSETGWREAYSWYFYREDEQRMVISPDTAIRECKQLIKKFGYEDIAKIVVAFSQGGYLAPQLAPHLENVVEIVGVATGYREDYYPPPAKFKITAIHGTDDEIFPIAQARTTHGKILSHGFHGDFIELPGLKHIAAKAVGNAIESRVLAWS